MFPALFSSDSIASKFELIASFEPDEALDAAPMGAL